MNTHYRDRVYRHQTVEAAAKRSLGSDTLEALEAVNVALPDDPARTANLEKLTRRGAVAVVTGQQTGLFLGPLLTLYKALTAIRAAAQLEEETGHPVVPIFWLQTEDHDFDEIRSTAIHDREGRKVPLTLPPLSSSEAPSVQYLRLPEDLTTVITDLRETLGGFPAAASVLEKVTSTYRVGRSLPDAFTELMAMLTQGSGLLFFNPRHPAAIRASAPVHARAFAEFEAIGRLLSQRTEELEANGQQTPVRIRADSPLSFLHIDSAGGSRTRLVREGSNWRGKGFGGDFTLSEETLNTLLAASPDRFSSSALLRPIVQDTLLPTALYVGGAAEQAYWQQITPLYRHFDVSQSLFLPRASFTLLEPSSSKWLNLLSLTAAELRLPIDKLERVIAERNASDDATPSVLLKQSGDALRRMFAALEGPFRAADPTLSGSLTKAESKMLHLLESTIERYTKAVARNDELFQERLRKLRSLILPEDLPQERVYTPIDFLCRFGESMIGALLAAIDPFNPSHKELAL
ncbi:MAG: bacillithiol biosynthesis cysteine-adding enzyme BshC [Bdellovibrionales bacterium]|nr:bacillithiol biosynthesis cysteine-adding enzyme BshC [Bdellovibrionales bacterium]